MRLRGNAHKVAASALVVVLIAIGTLGVSAGTATAGTTVFCDYSGGLGLGPGQWCQGPRHSLTLTDTDAVFPTSTNYVCATSRNPDGSLNAIYCSSGYVAAGPYCGCVLRYGIVINGESLASTHLDGMEYW